MLRLEDHYAVKEVDPLECLVGTPEKGSGRFSIAASCLDCHFQSYLAQFFGAIWRSVRFQSGVHDCLLRVVSHIRAFRLIDLLNLPRRFELLANRGSHHLAILPSENYAKYR